MYSNNREKQPSQKMHETRAANIWLIDPDHPGARYFQTFVAKKNLQYEV